MDTVADNTETKRSIFFLYINDRWALLSFFFKQKKKTKLIITILKVVYLFKSRGNLTSAFKIEHGINRHNSLFFFTII